MAGKTSPERLIFTDLDGTLLEHETYSWEPALPALKKVKEAGIPVIFCTSKTRAETEHFRKKLGNRHPFIVENGGAIYIPRGYFREEIHDAVRKGKYLVIQLGRPYKELRLLIKEMRKKGLRVRGFGDLSTLALRRLTGLSLRQARLAKKREYDEPFMIEEPKQEPRVLEMISKQALQHTKGGRFHHVMGNNDKGFAAKILTSIYQQEFDRPLVTTGLGDSPNDFSMLRAVHIPYLVKRPDKSYASKSRAFLKANGIGPAGWNSAVLSFMLEEL